MATPSAARPHSNSTPRATFAATPTHMISSPRPATSASMARPVSHKSPAIKTPASIHGHNFNQSSSSHPSSTPLAAIALGEDVLAFSSPAAAFMASLSSHGLTPLPMGQDGLGITTEPRQVSTRDGSVVGGRNAEEDKSRRLQEMMRMLRTRVAGRGICREGVERVAQLSGFTYLWQDDNFTIAGTCVDLEIIFDNVQRDLVKDVVLKINDTEVEEHKKEASAMLMKDLAGVPGEGEKLPWRQLDNFAANLTDLSQLDSLSQGINCFEAIEGLYYSFRKIWEGEKVRLRGKRALSRLCQGSIGRPRMNRKYRLGLGLDYWSDSRLLHEAKSQGKGGDGIDNDGSDFEADRGDLEKYIWTGRIDCETGYPPIRVSKEWLADSVFESQDSNDQGQGEKKAGITPAWLDPAPTLVAVSDVKNDSSSVAIGTTTINIPKPPNVRFSVKFEPNVVLPVIVLQTLGTQGLQLNFDNQNISTYQQALRNLEVPRSSSASNKNGVDPVAGNDNAQTPTRWLRDVTTFDKKGQARSHRHSYVVYSGTPLWCCVAQSMNFEHPRQLAELIPTLRQYALLWTILRKLVPDTGPPPRQETSPSKQPALHLDSPKKKKGRQKKSNMNSRRAELNMILNNGAPMNLDGPLLSTTPDQIQPPAPSLAIDISLNLTSTTPFRPKLDLIIPLPPSTDKNGSSTSAKAQRPAFAGVSIEIGLDGEITVVSASGLLFATESISNNNNNILQKMAQVLSLSEDLGVFVQWILDRVG